MITTFRTLTAAGVAVLGLAGGAALTGAAAQADDGGAAQQAPARPAHRTLVSSCSGGANIATLSRTMNFQSVPGGTNADLDGSQWTVSGPKTGTDTVLVTLTSLAASGGSGELTSVEFRKDGVTTSEGAKYFTYNGEYDQAAVQFCTKIGKGVHTLNLRVDDASGGATSLNFPTVTYQRFS